MSAGYFDKAVRLSFGQVAAGAAIEVRHTGGGLADIYSNAAMTTPLSNPGVLGDDGRYEFYALFGVYNITVGAGASAATYRFKLDGDGTNFLTRADFVSAVADGYAPAGGTVVTIAGLSWMVIPVGHAAYGTDPISDLPGWMPVGDTTPDHFAVNTTPGTTNMTAAINAAIAFSQSVKLLASTYYINSGIVMPDARKSKLSGEGWGVSTIVTDTSGFDMITILGTTGRPQDCHVWALTLEHTGSARTSGAHIKAENYPLFCSFRGVRLKNIYTGFDMQGGQKCMFDWCHSNGQWSGSAGNALFDFNVTDGNWNTTEIYISNCDGYANNGTAAGVNRAIRINRCDGVFISNSHFFDFNYGLYTNPDSATYAWQDTVAAIVLTGVYFDRAYASNIYMTGNASNAYRGIMLTNCHVMRGQGVDGNIVFDSDDITDFQMIGGRVYGAQTYGINSKSGKLPSGLRVHGTQFYDNAISGTGADIRWYGTGANITGTTHRGGHASGVCVSFGNTSSDNQIANTNMSDSIMGSEYVDAGTDNWRDGYNEGTNANGTFRRHINGHLECWHSLAASGAGDTTWTYPYAFASGTTPIPSLTCGSLAGPTPIIANLSGAPAATSLAFNAFNGAGARQVVTMRLRAVGDWK